MEVLITSMTPNARSILVRCNHCRHQFRIKLEPNDPEEIKRLFDAFMGERKNYSPYQSYYPIWEMKINQRRVPNLRVPIPSNVKKAVWKRDGGKCVNCGSEIDLQYDHIIPVAKGGSSTFENIQILCKKCNLKKHASIE